jgi:NAD(P)-dependent dehydrogenase (short-subunit alcohol dehydrogenase family)|tara:strand:- start:9429 stop:10232 length:804 start_codon:yes stop_codon:yes gene_type:complete
VSAGRLAGRVAFVTGGLRGIGHAAAARMLDEGATVIVSDLDSESDAHDLLGDLADKVGYVQANVTDEGDWARALDHVKQAHGACHILVNNAGIDLTGAVETLELEDWRRIMAINVDGVFMGTKRFVPLMAESGGAVEGGASIVNVSSIMGLVGYAEVSAYNASKGAVRLFTKGIAIEFATKGMPIRANSVHPGFVETPLLKAGFQRWVDKGVAEKPQDLVDAMNAATPMGRLAQPREIAAGIAFLAGPDASYMTGSEMVIDGGWTAQ